MKKFHRKLARVIQKNKYELIFIDGILLYEDPQLVCMLDKKYFIDLEKEECYRRRLNRSYILKVCAYYIVLII